MPIIQGLPPPLLLKRGYMKDSTIVYQKIAYLSKGRFDIDESGRAFKVEKSVEELRKANKS